SAHDTRSAPSPARTRILASSRSCLEHAEFRRSLDDPLEAPAGSGHERAIFIGGALLASNGHHREVCSDDRLIRDARTERVGYDLLEQNHSRGWRRRRTAIAQDVRGVLVIPIVDDEFHHMGVIASRYRPKEVACHESSAIRNTCTLEIACRGLREKCQIAYRPSHRRMAREQDG